jgi:hypothetical protein
MGGGWCSQGGVCLSWYWFAHLVCLPRSDSVIQPLEESNKFLELLRDVVRQDKCILDCVVQAPYESSAFLRVMSLNVSSVALEFCIIGGEVTVCLLEHLQLLFCCRHMICVPKCCFQTVITAGTSVRWMPLLVI